MSSLQCHNYIERLQANKIELCTIAMMNTEMGFAERCATTEARECLEDGKAAKTHHRQSILAEEGMVHSVVDTA